MRESSGGVWARALHVIVDGHNLLAETSRISGGVRLHSEMRARPCCVIWLPTVRKKPMRMTAAFDGW